MSISSASISVGTCYFFSEQETRKVLEIDGLRVRSQPHNAGGWGDAVWAPLDEFASKAQHIIACPV